MVCVCVCVCVRVRTHTHTGCSRSGGCLVAGEGFPGELGGARVQEEHCLSGREPLEQCNRRDRVCPCWERTRRQGPVTKGCAVSKRELYPGRCEEPCRPQKRLACPFVLWSLVLAMVEEGLEVGKASNWAGPVRACRTPGRVWREEGQLSEGVSAGLVRLKPQRVGHISGCAVTALGFSFL